MLTGALRRVVAIGIVVLLLSSSCSHVDRGTQIVALPVIAGNFERAQAGRVFQFPRDHGAHETFQSEWWYYTGNMATVTGEHFGYQLTFFRRALLPQKMFQERQSGWSTNQVYLAHFALSDVAAGKYMYAERLQRGAAGIAGAVGEPAFSVWLDHWSVTQIGDQRYRLYAAHADCEITLDLTEQKSPILQGKDGYSQKGEDVGNASYYYSQTRLATSGRIYTGNRQYDVTGFSWMDHEFSTSALSVKQVGWDWFALQLDDGSELMVYVIRRQDGNQDVFSAGSVVDPEGVAKTLTYHDFQIVSKSTWRSPHSGAVYPIEWEILVPQEDLSFGVEALLTDQELNVSFVYWEGAVRVQGVRRGRPVTGYGYVEMTGYAHSMQGQF